jgi:signal peptidase II
MARRISAWLLLCCTLALVGCDHATKLAASSVLRAHPVTLVPRVLDLQYTENRDVAFSLLRGLPIPARPVMLFGLAFAGLAFVAMLWWRRRHKAATAEHAAWALIAAGALGNFLDRAVRGYVVDFIHLHHWPVFNVADIAVVAGAALLLIVHWRRPRASPA